MKTLTEDQRQLAARYIPFARSIALRSASNWPAKADDIHSAALLALVTSARDYDPSRGIEFTTFARHRIRGEVVNAIYRDSAGLGGTSAMLNRKLPVPRCYSRSSLPRGRFLAAGRVPRPGRDACERDAAEAILRKLPSRHRVPLGLMAFDGLNQAEAAAAMGCSQSEVSRLVRQSRTFLEGIPCSC
jgi:RNA polymerase sigma factor (sigma-70 family)